MNYKLYKQQAEEFINSLYSDCENFTEWDTTDPENWRAMRDIIEKIADHFELKLNTKEEE